MKVLLKGGMLIDGTTYVLPAQQDVIIEDTKILAVVPKNSQKEDDFDDIVDVSGLLISPGIIDLHVHISDGLAKIGCMPDIIGKNLGVSTVIDAGTYGSDTFSYLYDNIISKSKTKVYAWLNVASCGLTTLSELQDLSNINKDKIQATLKKYPDTIIGIKVRASGSVVGQNGITPIIMAKEIAKENSLPLMVHIGNPPPFVDDVLNLLTKGDVVTHCYHNKKENLFEGNKIRQTALLAKKRGVLFDIGHGSASFSFDTAIAMISSKFKPDFISTDIYDKNIEHPVKSQFYVMSKMMTCGLSLAEVITKTTSKIAQEFKLKNIGRIKEGYIADLSVFSLYNEEYFAEDSVGKKVKSRSLLESHGVFINGKYYKK